MAISTSSTLLTTKETAERLGLSKRRVYALCAAGELDTLTIASRGTLITFESVQRYAQWRGSDGRPYSRAVALGALYLISGEDAPWMSTQQRYRLNRYLNSIDSVGLATRCRRRARAADYWCRDSMLANLAQQVRITAGTGELASAFGLSTNQRVEGYATGDDAERIIRDCRLKKALGQDSVRLRVAEFLPAGEGAMPLGVCAADLAESTDPRERHAGLGKLDDLISAFKNKEFKS